MANTLVATMMIFFLSTISATWPANRAVKMKGMASVSSHQPKRQRVFWIDNFASQQ